MSATLPLALVHGWAFDPAFWSATRTALGRARTRCLDFGFFAPHAHMELPQEPYIGVGHSLGTLWLLRHHGPLCRGMILINGFSRFGAGPDFTAGIGRRVIERMRQGLLRAPQGLLHSFRLRAGIDAPVPEPIQRDRLETGLEALMDMDCRADLNRTTCPVHVMAGTQDAIAPPALTEACFAARPVEWVEGGHLLPLTHATACANAITTMARRMMSS